MKNFGIRKLNGINSDILANRMYKALKHNKGIIEFQRESISYDELLGAANNLGIEWKKMRLAVLL